MKITRKTDLQTLASIICENLLQHGVDAVLSGGAVVSIYTKNAYESKDLDFITEADSKSIAKALSVIGFKKMPGRYFSHPDTVYFVEFPPAPLAVGDMPIREWVTQKNKGGRLQLLSPTHSVMDRLAGFFHWNDKQNLDQALLIAKHHPIKIREIENWARNEDSIERFNEFKQKLKLKK